MKRLARRGAEVLQVKDLMAGAQEKGKEKGLKGRRYRRFVEREFNKRARKHIRVGQNKFKMIWGEKGELKGVQAVSRHDLGGKPPVRNVPKAAPKGQAISSSAEGEPAQDHMGESV